MTIYNAEKYLYQSIDSLISQTYSNWELVAIENGSTDRSRNILKEYKDERIQLFELEENIGRTPALIMALEKAQGKYICVLDADDISSTDRIMIQKDFLEKNPDVVLAGAWAKIIDGNDNLIGEWKPGFKNHELHDSLSWINPFVHSSVMYRREDAIKAGGYPKNYIYAQDYAFIIEIARQGKLALIDEFLCQLRVDDNRMSSSRKYNIIIMEEGLRLLKYVSDIFNLNDEAKDKNKCSIAIYKIKMGLGLISNKSLLKGLTIIFEAIINKPSILYKNSYIQKLFGNNTITGFRG